MPGRLAMKLLKARLCKRKKPLSRTLDLELVAEYAGMLRRIPQTAATEKPCRETRRKRETSSMCPAKGIYLTYIPANGGHAR